MPTYEFECHKCDNTFEEVVSMTTMSKKIDANKEITKCYFCGIPLTKENIRLNSTHSVNVPKDPKNTTYKKYRNKHGGPAGIVGKEIVGKAGL